MKTYCVDHGVAVDLNLKSSMEVVARRAPVVRQRLKLDARGWSSAYGCSVGGCLFDNHTQDCADRALGGRVVLRIESKGYFMFSTANYNLSESVTTICRIIQLLSKLPALRNRVNLLPS